MNKKVFTESQIKDIVNDYTDNHLSTLKIGKAYGVSKGVISRVLKENNVEIRHDNHTYYADYNAFETIDTPEKAYWLGFLAADGCNYNREKNATILINLHQKDENHLIKFRDFLKSNVKIKEFISNAGFSNNTPMCNISINSLKMSDDLTKLGITPKKSLTLKPPKIDEDFYLPFILGYFDGDGSISKTSQYNNYCISIVGTKELLEWINSILNISSSLEQKKDATENNYYIRCGGTEKPYKILKRLYDSVNTHLDRKYNIFKELELVVLRSNSK